MKVSILMPSRKRPEHALNAIRSLGPGNIEFLVCIDKDDPTYKEYDTIRKQEPRMQLFFEKRHGYDGLHNYYNLLASKATGDWLMLFNDDALMETELWLDKIWRYNHTVPHILTFHEKDNLFPIISKPLFDLIGHYSLSPHVDSWAQYIGENTGIQTLVPDINIAHLREDMNDDVYREGREHVRNTSPLYNSGEMTRLRDKDVQKVKEWAEGQK